MKLFNRSLLALAITTSCMLASQAQAESLAITNAKIFTETEQGVLENASILIEDGVVTAINSQDIKADKIIDAKGQVVTPGFIGSMNILGLVEVSAVSTSRDAQDKKADVTFIPSLAFNPKASTIAFARKGGITHNVVSSAGGGKGIFAGQTFNVDLSGEWDSVVNPSAGVFVTLGESEKGSRAIGMQQLWNTLEDAKFTKKNGKPDTDKAKKIDRDALIFDAVLAGDKPLIVAVNRASDIINLIKLKQEFNIDLVIVGAADAVTVAVELVKAKVPVVIDALSNLPDSFDSLHNALDNAAKLSAAGVQVVLTMPADSHGLYALRHSAGIAVANGMQYNEAITAVTSNAADVFNIEAGRIQIGKPADMVLWSGDPFEYSTKVNKLWINGKLQSTESRQDKLRDRYLSNSDMPEAYNK